MPPTITTSPIIHMALNVNPVVMVITSYDIVMTDVSIFLPVYLSVLSICVIVSQKCCSRNKLISNSNSNW